MLNRSERKHIKGNDIKRLDNILNFEGGQINVEIFSLIRNYLLVQLQAQKLGSYNKLSNIHFHIPQSILEYIVMIRQLKT